MSYPDPVKAYELLHPKPVVKAPEKPATLKDDLSVCKYVGDPVFAPDRVRYCQLHKTGGTCQIFRLKPFEECPMRT